VNVCIPCSAVKSSRPIAVAVEQDDTDTLYNCSCDVDLDLDPMTLIYELDLKITEE